MFIPGFPAGMICGEKTGGGRETFNREIPFTGGGAHSDLTGTHGCTVLERYLDSQERAGIYNAGDALPALLHH